MGPRGGLHQSLRVRFVGIMLGLAVVPLILLPALLGTRAHNDLETQSIELQSEVARGISIELESTLRDRAAELAQLDEVSGIRTADSEHQRLLLRNLMASQRMYQELAVVDGAGQELIRVARDNAVVGTDLVDRSDDHAFRQAVTARSTSFGPVTYDEEAREPLMTIARPLVDPRTAHVEAVLVAGVRFKPVWDVLAALDLEEGRDVFLVNSDGLVVAHRNPAVVLRGTSYQPPVEAGTSVGLDGENAMVAASSISLEGQELIVVATQPLATAMRVATEVVHVTGVLILLAAAAALAAIVMISRRFIQPIEGMAAVARHVAGGDLSQRVRQTSSDEIGELAGAFNEMTGRLAEMVESLEWRVRERTVELERAGERQRDLIGELESNNAELAEVRQRLERLLASKDEFLGSVSHELRTPLTSVVGFATELRDHHADFDPTEQRELIAMIASQAEDMASIINDLLVAARADSNGLVVRPDNVDLAAEILSMLDHLPGIVSRCHLPDKVQAFVDPTRLRQVLRNLIVNADRYGGPNVEIGVGTEGRMVIVEVRDDGAGIPTEEWETIFDPYTRSHHREGQPASVGLGLTVSRILARRMDGDLAYRYEDGQSVFELILPADDTARRRQPSTRPPLDPADRPPAGADPRSGAIDPTWSDLSAPEIAVRR